MWHSVRKAPVRRPANRKVQIRIGWAPSDPDPPLPPLPPLPLLPPPPGAPPDPPGPEDAAAMMERVVASDMQLPSDMPGTLSANALLLIADAMRQPPTRGGPMTLAVCRETWIILEELMDSIFDERVF